MDKETLVAQRAQKIQQRCLHFTGLQHQTCGAGVRYFSPGPQPCFLDHDTGKHVCPKRQFPTPEEASRQAEDDVAGWEEALEAFMARHGAGLCVDCGAPTGGLRQVGRCVYAVACGHRQYQGRQGKES